MKRLLVIVLLSLLPAALRGDEPQPSFLFVQYASSGRLTPIKGSPQEMTLTLRGVSPSIVYFSDRPFREAGSQPLTELVDAWGSGTHNFLDDPPNAALEIPGGKVAILELGSPRYDEAAKSITYRVRPLSLSNLGTSTEMFVPDFGARDTTLAQFPRKFSQPFLVIDSFTPGDADNSIYRVIENHGRMTIWPVDRKLPDAALWSEIDPPFHGTKDECLKHISDLWRSARL